MGVVVVESAALDAAVRAELRRLWDRAFGDRFDDTDAEHADGGIHVLTREGAHLVGHAAAVPRRIRFGQGPWRTVGYVEAVATEPDRQGEGVGRRTMTVLQEQIRRRWPVALLSTGRATGFYEALGWQRWRGPTLTRSGSGTSVDDRHGGVMVLRCDPAHVLDLDAAVTCEDRSGHAW